MPGRARWRQPEPNSSGAGAKPELPVWEELRFPSNPFGTKGADFAGKLSRTGKGWESQESPTL